MSQFESDLALGGQVEEQVLDSLRSRSPLFKYAYRTQGAVKGSDIVLNLGIEVKCDLRSGDTGNVAIETSCNGKPSGITASTSMFWVVVIPTGQFAGSWWVPAAQLRLTVSERKSIPAGDRKAARVVLLPVTEFVKIQGVYRLSDAPSVK
jgi:hypothetical protein